MISHVNCVKTIICISTRAGSHSRTWSYLKMIILSIVLCFFFYFSFKSTHAQNKYIINKENDFSDKTKTYGNSNDAVAPKTSGKYSTNGEFPFFTLYFWKWFEVVVWYIKPNVLFKFSCDSNYLPEENRFR